MNEMVMTPRVSARIPTSYGDFRLLMYQNDRDAKEHLALVMGKLSNAEDVLVRVHSECFTGDVLGSVRCDCGEQLDRSMRLIAGARRGVLLYLRQEGRGIGLLDKLRAYNLQDEGLDTVEANLRLGHRPDEREYGAAAVMIRDLGIRSVNLLTNNPTKIRELRRLGIVVCGRTAIEVDARPENVSYLHTKRSRMDHLLQLGGNWRLSDDQPWNSK